MPITRAKASRLLNQSEMGLYDDSRANALRDLDAKALASRIKRARTARDRARDLVQKQKLASRARTGSKRGASGADNQRSKDKAELMADILKRFEQQLKTVERADRDAARAATKSTKAASKKKTASKKTAAKKATSKKTASKKTAVTKTASKKARSKQATPKRSAATRAAATKAAASGPAAKKEAAARQPGATQPTTPARASRKPASRRTASVRTSPAGTTARAVGAKPTGAARKASRKRRIAPEQALEQTRALLEAKHAHDAEPKPWQDLPTGPAVSGEPGFQSDAAARRAARLHAAEARIPAIQGSVSTRDRINQGKRDHRGDGD